MFDFVASPLMSWFFTTSDYDSSFVFIDIDDDNIMEYIETIDSSGNVLNYTISEHCEGPSGEGYYDCAREITFENGTTTEITHMVPHYETLSTYIYDDKIRSRNRVSSVFQFLRNL